MPRNGSDIFYVLPGTEGFPDQTIESEKYNNYIHDVETDLNKPRPIIAGGTGANNANDALSNLNGEKSSQLVTNYDTHVWYPGSFRSAIGAAGAPTAPAGQTATHPFVGWVVSSDPVATPPTNQNVVVRAHDQSGVSTPGRVYVREKKAGVWGVWATDGSTGITSETPPLDPADGALWWDSESGQLYVYYRDVDSAAWVIASPSADPDQFVQKAGDTMTGALKLSGWPVDQEEATSKEYVDYYTTALDSRVNDLASGKVAKAGDTMDGNLTIKNTYPRLILDKPSTTTNSAITFSTAGFPRWLLASIGPNEEFDLMRYNVDGTFNDYSFSVKQVSKSFEVYDEFRIAISSGNTGIIRFGDTSASYLYFDGSSFTLNGGPFSVGGNISTTQAVYAATFVASSGSGIFIGPASIQESGGSGGGNTVFRVNGNSSYVDYNKTSGQFTWVVNDAVGMTLEYSGNLHVFTQAFKPGGGSFADSSDSRIKNVEGDYTVGLAEIAQLRPVAYTFKGNDTNAAPEGTVPYKNSMHFKPATSGTKFAGLVAQEVEGILPSMVTHRTGYIDGIAVSDLRDLDTHQLVFALINAVKELKARIEVLEGA